MTDDLDSSSKGIWVFPHDPAAAGPSTSKPTRKFRNTDLDPQNPGLGDIYTSSLQAYRAAYEAYENKRTEEQLDDITDWLDHSSRSHSTSSSSLGSGSGSGSRFHRLPVGILQKPAKQVHLQIKTINTRLEVLGIQGRDIGDVGSGIRAITAGLVGLGGGEIPAKSGLTGLDLVERWWKGRKDSPTLVLHIQDAQVVPPPVLAEIMYILCLHPILPIRILLSVPSTSTFLSQWQMLEPSSIDLTILSSSRGRRRQTALGAMLGSGHDASVTVGEELAEALRGDEAMYGQGPEGALKAIQWSMLHHSANSSLSTLDIKAEGGQGQLSAIRTILDTIKSDPNTSIPGRELFHLPAHDDLEKVTDPAPRISILQALSNPALFTEHLAPLSVPAQSFNSNGIERPEPEPELESVTTPRKSSKRRKHSSSPDRDTVFEANTTNGNGNGDIASTGLGSEEKGDLKDLEILFGLWKGAGKNVNLWDWLQGYRNSMASEQDQEQDQEQDHDHDHDKDGEQERGEGDTNDSNPMTPKKRSRPDETAEGQGQGREKPRDTDTDTGGVDEDRLHATFVRFCEEARMLGLVRARGKAVGRKADEVVKGITLV